MPTGHYAFFFMHMYAYRMRARTDADADAERNGTAATGRERPDINTCPSHGRTITCPGVVHVLAGALSSFNGGACGNLSSKLPPRTFYDSGAR